MQQPLGLPPGQEGGRVGERSIDGSGITAGLRAAPRTAAPQLDSSFFLEYRSKSLAMLCILLIELSKL